jgi:hypothetical protein
MAAVFPVFPFVYMRRRQARKRGPPKQNFLKKGMEEIRVCRI